MTDLDILLQITAQLQSACTALIALVEEQQTRLLTGEAAPAAVLPLTRQISSATARLCAAVHNNGEFIAAYRRESGLHARLNKPLTLH